MVLGFTNQREVAGSSMASCSPKRSSREGASQTQEVAIRTSSNAHAIMSKEAGTVGSLKRPRCWRGPLGLNPFPTIQSVRGPFILMLLSCCLSPASASASAGINPDSIPTEATTTVTATVDDINTECETLLIGTRTPGLIHGHWQIMSHEHHEFHRRDVEVNKRHPADATHTTEVIINVSTITAVQPATTETATQTAPTATAVVAKPLPSPLDGGFTFTDRDCLNFIDSFLTNDTFKACYPMSLLLQGSQSFFTAEKSRFDITRVLDTACGADVSMCTGYFNTLASDLVAQGNCGKEFDEKDPVVFKAHQGMTAYETVYKAACLTDQDSSSPDYCFTIAITNATTPSNSYLYFLPLNESLPSTAAPSCNSCTRQTMQIYQAATSDPKADIVNTYPDAAKQINAVCGNNFVDTALSAVAPSIATLSTHPTSLSSPILFSLALMAISRWIV